jgi:hypothetical protein
MRLQGQSGGSIQGFMHFNLTTLAHLTLAVLGCFFPFIVFDKSRIRALWAKWSFMMIGLFCAIIGVVKIAASFGWIHFTTEISIWREKYILASMGGFVLGLFFTIIISGELLGKKITSPANE